MEIEGGEREVGIKIEVGERKRERERERERIWSQNARVHANNIESIL